ncbi:tRNA1(Val) (adenine(37)-N6)-methyltransferase [Thiovibrio sp. JS02]
MDSSEAVGEQSFDTLFAGRLHCRQHRRGYRFSVDAVLLAHFLVPKKNDRILDLCAGCGVVALILAHRWPEARLTALDVQPRLAELIRINSAENGFAERIQVVEGDCRRMGGLLPAGGFDCLVCNPPYRKVAGGRRNLLTEQAVARHEILADLAAVVRAAAFALKTRGRAAFVYPASRAAGLLACLVEHGFAPKRLQVVHSYPGDIGRLVLVEAVKNGGEGMNILPPFHVYEEKGGDYTTGMAACYAP